MTAPHAPIRVGVRPTDRSEVLKAAIQIQVQVEALTTTAQAAAKQARLLTKYVGTLGEVSERYNI